MDRAIGHTIATTGPAARYHQADPPGPKAGRSNHNAANHYLDDFAGESAGIAAPGRLLVPLTGSES
jgi:hypothetical protein